METQGGVGGTEETLRGAISFHCFLCVLLLWQKTLWFGTDLVYKSNSPNDRDLGQGTRCPWTCYTTCKVGICTAMGRPTLTPLQKRTCCEEWSWLTALAVTPSGPMAELMSSCSQPRTEHVAGTIVSTPAHGGTLLTAHLCSGAAPVLLRLSPSCTLAPCSSTQTSTLPSQVPDPHLGLGPPASTPALSLSSPVGL